MKKRIITLAAMLLLAVAPVAAQVFVMEGEEANRDGSNGFPLIDPVHGVTYDQYAPVGSGAALLIGLGAAYLLVKRKRNGRALARTCRAVHEAHAAALARTRPTAACRERHA